MAALRFLLGIFEAGIYPALTLLVSTFYRRSEQVFRLGCVWLCNGSAVAIGGLIAYAIGRMDDRGIARWRCVYVTNRTNQTLYVASIMMFIGAIGTLLMVLIPEPKYKLIGQYLGLASVSSYVLMVASISNNVSGYTKKIFYNGMMMIFYTIGNFVGPFVMAPKFAPHYVGSLVIYVCAMMISAVLLLVARWRMALINRQRLMRLSGMVTNVEDDLTDVQDPNFIYRL
ncbi:hypothetical protein DFQ29_002023 [Apophysomyces sp. BC1021]|nr:hypothetical protein DFQ29_002023 [Apophysomyces sp. BC1021]